MKAKYILVLAITLSPAICFGQQKLAGADSARMLVDTALNYAAKNSLYKSRINFSAIKDSVKTASANATNLQEAMPAIKLLYKMLGDYHGGAFYKGISYKWNDQRNKVDKKNYTALLSKIKSGSNVESRIIDKDYGYIVIPANNPTHEGDLKRIAEQIQDSLAVLNPAKLKGVIIDLRTNYGGNMYPMILGVGNLLSKGGKLGSFVYPGSKHEEPWFIKNDTIFADTEKVLFIRSFCKVNPKIKVAVLTSPYTASSGEATAISFKGQQNARIIGETTAGYTTANESMFFMGVEFLFATAVEADRNSTIYYQNVTPDEEVIAGDNFIDLNKDAKIITALAWLKKRP